MMSLIVVFWVFVVLFAVIGAMRGWAKEVLVSSSIILAIFIIAIAEKWTVINNLSDINKLWFRCLLTGSLAFFGYQTPNLSSFIKPQHFVREKFRDMLVGFFMGAVNGYLIFGTLWYFIAQAKYPGDFITAPDAVSDLGKAVQSYLHLMPPSLLGTPLVYFAVAVAFVLVIVVFV
jgi:uncharacterized membrane protein required for colicin V production